MAVTEPPAPPLAVLYVDTSALLKLLVREAESAAIERELDVEDALKPIGVRVIAPEEATRYSPTADASTSGS
jgi:hypothetical protein